MHPELQPPEKAQEVLVMLLGPSLPSYSRRWDSTRCLCIGPFVGLASLADVAPPLGLFIHCGNKAW